MRSKIRPYKHLPLISPSFPVLPFPPVVQGDGNWGYGQFITIVIAAAPERGPSPAPSRGDSSPQTALTRVHPMDNRAAPAAPVWLTSPWPQPFKDRLF